MVKRKEKISKKKVEEIQPRRIRKVTKKFSETSRTAIIAAFGFIIALAWRDFILEIVEKMTAINPLQGKLITALLITFIGVIGVILATPEEPEEK